ncbi:hypothetical protein GH733_016456, partial [Mirounga leonina]
SNKVPVVQPSHAVHPLTPLITYSDEHFSPGSHPPHLPSDVNSKQGMSRHPPAPEIPTFYPLSPGGVGQITPPLGWQGQPVYPITGGFRQPYPSSLSVDTSMSRFSHHMIPGPPGPHTTGIPHPAIVTPQVKQEHPHTDSDLMHVLTGDMNRCSASLLPCPPSPVPPSPPPTPSQPPFRKPQHEQRKEQEPKRPHIKKPLNAFMLYMKEMRANVVAECTLKESAAINQILGRRWHALSREEQAKYYELARKERQLHMQLYPGWSARDNYGKKKKRKREKLQESTSGLTCHLSECWKPRALGLHTFSVSPWKATVVNANHLFIRFSNIREDYLQGDVGESDELLSKGWGPGAPEAYAASLQSFRVGLEPPSGLAMGLRPEESLPEP